MKKKEYNSFIHFNPGKRNEKPSNANENKISRFTSEKGWRTKMEENDESL